MSTTLKIVNGQIDIDSATGQINTVQGNRKCGQDMGEALLQQYLPEQDYGSYLAAIVQNKIPHAQELFVRYYVADAVGRLQAMQAADVALTEAEQITRIIALQTATDGDAGVVFYVSVETADGEVAKVGAETQLNHQFERF